MESLTLFNECVPTILPIIAIVNVLHKMTITAVKVKRGLVNCNQLFLFFFFLLVIIIIVINN